MLMGYTGKVINGKPTLTETIALPENADIIIMVLPQLPQKDIDIESEWQTDEKNIENIENIEKRLQMLKSITGIIPPDIDVEAMRAERIAKRGLLE